MASIENWTPKMQLRPATTIRPMVISVVQTALQVEAVLESLVALTVVFFLPISDRLERRYPFGDDLWDFPSY